MQIIRALPEDAYELVGLVNSAYRGESSTLGWTSEAHLLEGSRIDLPTMQEYLQSNSVTILKCTDNEAQSIGCVYLEPKGSAVYLGMLTVSPLKQAIGIGKHLLLAAEDFCRSLEIIKLTITVITTRSELIAWYERRGFVATGEVQDFIIPEKFGISKHPIQLLVMDKKVD